MRTAGSLVRLLRQPTLASTIIFAVSGAAFALGNLLLARGLPVEGFGRVALALALFNILILLAPIGIDQQLLRRRIDPGLPLLMLLLGSGAAMSATAGVVAVVSGGLSTSEAVWMAVASIAGCVITTASTALRMRDRTWAALALVTIASFILFLVGVLVLILHSRDTAVPLAMFAFGNIAAAVIGWVMLSRSCRVGADEREPILWREAGSLLGIALIGTLSLQIERVVVPIPLGLRELAVFSVLASVAIFPFRLLTAGVNFAVVPRLRAATDKAARYRILTSELLLVAAITALVWPLVILAAPPVTAIVTKGGYTISRMLAAAACCNGSVKVLMTLPRAILTACGTQGDLATLNRLGIVWLVLAITGAFIGAKAGLAGLLWGVSAGGLLAILPAANLARRRLREVI